MNLMAPLHRARARLTDPTRAEMRGTPGGAGEVPPRGMHASLLPLMRQGILDLTGPVLLFGAPGTGKTTGLCELSQAAEPETPETYLYSPDKDHVNTGLTPIRASFCAHDLDGAMKLLNAAREVVHARRYGAESAAQVGRPVLLVADELPIMLGTTHSVHEEDRAATRVLWDLLFFGPEHGVRVYATTQQLSKVPPHIADRFQLVFTRWPNSPARVADYATGRQLQEETP